MSLTVAPSPVPPRSWVRRRTRPLRARLLLNRLGCGWSPQDEALMTAAGGPNAWFSAQLHPSGVAESSRIDEVDGWFGYLRDSPNVRYTSSISGGRGSYQYGLGLGNWTILRRIYSTRPVLETMVDFWSDHFNVPVTHGQAWLHRFDYDATIRTHALGRFEDLLVACSLHPSMRFYLDNWLSKARNTNENQGRELLELHTVGVNGGYTEDMVKASAKILSGYTMNWGTTFEAYYDPARHAVGPVSVLGFRHDNTSSDGRPVVAAYLSYLARHPATARHLARKIALRFVSDSPSEALVGRLASVYLTTGTSIAAVLEALVASPEFRASEGRKARRPVADLVATAKVLAVEVKEPTATNSWATGASYLHGGDRLYSWPRPDGPPLIDPPWSSPGRVFRSTSMHMWQVGGYNPTVDVTYRSPSEWRPSTDMAYSTLVDQLCRRFLGKPADARLAAVGAQALSGVAGATVGPSRPLSDYSMIRLVSALLDTPDHMNS